jgi:hypothetical protein
MNRMSDCNAPRPGSGQSQNHPLRTFQQLRTNSGECLHSNYREAAWNDRHGRNSAVNGVLVVAVGSHLVNMRSPRWQWPPA